MLVAPVLNGVNVGNFCDQWQDRVDHILRHMVVVDTETGGLDPEKSALLEVALVCGADALNLHIDDPGEVSDEALQYNGMDMTLHKAVAVHPDTAWGEITSWLARQRMKLGAERLWICGQNVGFDVAFMQRLYRICSRPIPRIFTTYQMVDTHTMLWDRAARGEIPLNCTSLDHALAYYNIPCESRHSALGDAQATQALLRQMLSPK